MQVWLWEVLWSFCLSLCGVSGSWSAQGLFEPSESLMEQQTTDWFQIGKGVHQGCILSPCLFNLHAEYIMRNAGLDEAQTGIKIAGTNINNLRYADDITVMAKNEEELK